MKQTLRLIHFEAKNIGHNSRSILYRHIVIKKNATTVTTNYIFCYHFGYSKKICTKQLLWSCDCLERQLLKLEICADAWEIVPAHCHQISLIIQFLSDFVGELLPDCVYGCL